MPVNGNLSGTYLYAKHLSVFRTKLLKQIKYFCLEITSSHTRDDIEISYQESRQLSSSFLISCVYNGLLDRSWPIILPTLPIFHY